MIGERIREVRQSQGRSLADVAAKAGISVATLSRVETQKQSIDVDLLVALSGVLGVDASEMVGSSDGEGGEQLAQRIASLDSGKRTELWHDLAAERRNGRANARHNISLDVEELVAQVEFLRQGLDALRSRLKKRK